MTKTAAAVALALLVNVAAADEFEAGQAWLKAHNAVRATVGVPPLEWSFAAEKQARKWALHLAKLGKLEHSDVEAMGENLFAASGYGPISAEQAVADWASEKASFDAKTRTCKGDWSVCGHYTQLVWRNTTEVGCAVALAAKGEFEYVVVCNYLPPGNYEGKKAY